MRTSLLLVVSLLFVSTADAREFVCSANGPQLAHDERSPEVMAERQFDFPAVKLADIGQPSDDTAVVGPAPQSPWVVLIGTLLSILAPLLTALILKAVTWLHAHEKVSKLAFAGGVAGDLALSFINETEASLLPKLKEALADGNLSDAERASLKADLITLLKAKMPSAVLNTLSKAFGAGMEAWLGMQADVAIDRMATDAVVPK